MSASTMFNVAYGLGCDSSDDPTLIRMDKLLIAITQSAFPTQFLVVIIYFDLRMTRVLNLPIY
jgi:hypothetical protein